MSLDQLRRMRRDGSRPVGVIVLVGKPASAIDDDAGWVVVDQHGMDLRPLIGLPVHVLDLQGDSDLTRSVIDDLEALEVRPQGICGPLGACGVSPEHEASMQQFRRHLCAT